jgi:hypothetical protein
LVRRVSPAIHQYFNGALINNVPLLKKTGLKAVAGGGLLCWKDGTRHQEVFAGVDGFQGDADACMVLRRGCG